MTDDRLPLASADPDAERLAALRALYPEAFSDGRLDPDRLRRALGDATVADGPDRYELRWAGKADAGRALQTLSMGTLRPDRDASVGFDDTGHAIIEGDNLEVLKLLQKPYYGRVKLIYIDPPYNTGNDFIYPDNFSEGLDTYLRYTGQRDEDGRATTTNTETAGRHHSRWLSMMMPRLALARNLLQQDGAIFASVGEDEVHNLRHLMNEVFGAENYVAEMIWEGGLKNDSRFVSAGHDYILCYARDALHLRNEDVRWRTRKEGIEKIYSEVERLLGIHADDYKSVGDDLKDWYRQLPKGHPAYAHKQYSRVDRRGVFFPGDISWPGPGGPRYDVFHPQTGLPVKVPLSGWRYPKEERMREAIADDRVQFGVDETRVPTLKRYLSETEGQVLSSVFYQDRRAATKRLRSLMGADVFDNPKDETVLKKLFEGAGGTDDLIVDFFAGSGTTAQAVLDLNAEDGGTRRFILVQLPEKTPPGSSARAAGYDTIAEVTRERVRRAAQAHAKAAGGQLPLAGTAPQDRGFRAFRLDSSNFELWNADTAATDADALAQQLDAFADHLVPDRSDGDVLWEIVLKAGFPLSARVETLALPGGGQAHRVDGGLLVVCLDRTVTQATADAVLALEPERAVFLDHAFHGDDALKANARLAFQARNVHFQTA